MNNWIYFWLRHSVVIRVHPTVIGNLTLTATPFCCTVLLMLCPRGMSLLYHTCLARTYRYLMHMIVVTWSPAVGFFFAGALDVHKRQCRHVLGVLEVR